MRLVFHVLLLLPCLLSGEGVLRPFHGARDAGTAGAASASSSDLLGNLATNPAAITLGAGHEWALSGTGIQGDADFKRAGNTYPLRDAFGAFPEAAIVGKAGEAPLWLALSFTPLSALRSEWDYPDVAGGIGGIDYGNVNNESEFLVLATSLSAAWRISPEWSVGASASAVYSRVGFDAPFIFQTNPALANAKVDLDMETDGWAASVLVGALYQPTPDLAIGLSVRPETVLKNDGHARADFSAQLPVLGLGGTPPLADYDAETRNVLPLQIVLGTTWQATPALRLSTRLDWTRWSEAYDFFPVSLSNGSNAAINGAIGSSPSDRVPLQWDDCWSVAIGAEYQLNDAWSLRAGWRYAESPVPTRLVTPLNAAIMDQSLGIGAGWRGANGWKANIAYNYEFSSGEKIGTSGYNAGEYSNSSVDVSAHSLSVGIGCEF